MRKLVSISLFGDPERYGVYLPTYVLAHLHFFPVSEGWTLRVHIDERTRDSQRGRFLERLSREGVVEYRVMGATPPLTKGMIWRMAPVFDRDAGWVFCRDLDGCPMPRDRKVCEHFMISRAAVHTVHDNLAHAGIMGGLCGFFAPAFREQAGIQSLEDLYRFAGADDDVWAMHGTDQNVLNRLISQRPRLELLEHRFNGWTAGLPGPHRRDAGVYTCRAWSAPTPDGAEWNNEDPMVVIAADRLANHLGAAGYDIDAARRFFGEHGARELVSLVEACEADA